METLTSFIYLFILIGFSIVIHKLFISKISPPDHSELYRMYHRSRWGG